MRTFLAFALLLITLPALSQDAPTNFEGSKIKLNLWGDNIETTTEQPIRILVNRDAGTITIESPRKDVSKLFRGQMVRKLQGQMGDEGVKYSYQLDDNIMMHVHVDLKMILFTRSDIHPLEWGLQILDFEISE